MEINFIHGDALELADQVFLFKRTVREAALATTCTPPSWPSRWQGEPGSAMHIHQSVVDTRHRPEHVLDRRTASPRPLFFWSHRRAAEVPAVGDAAAGAQRQFLPPPDRRWSDCADQRPLGLSTTAPRACACRSPPPEARRVENRVAGADANPYLAHGRLARLRLPRHGRRDLEPTDPIKGSAYRLAHTLPRHDVRRDAQAATACKPLERDLRRTLHRRAVTL